MGVKYRKPIIIGIVVLAVAFLISALTNSTFALFSKDIYGVNTNVYSTGMLAIESKSKSENISLDNAVPMTDEDGVQTNPYIFTIKNVGNLDYLFDIKLLSTGSSDTTFLPQYIKLQIDDGEVTSLSSLVNGLIKSDITLLAGESIDVSIRIWLSLETPNTELGKSFDSKIVTDGYAIYTESNHEYSSMINYIKYLYTSSNPTQIIHNKKDGTSDKYYYSYQNTDKTWGLMNDGLKVSDNVGEGATEITNTTKLITGTEGNIRYFGPSASVNNYIYFNCDSYPSTNCEKWRIIGIVDGKVKIIRDDSIGNLAWDQDKNQDSSLTTYSNNWETSSLQLFLNGLYYNRGDVESHTYYSDVDGSDVKTLNMRDIGLKNDTTRGLISESIWYLGGYNSAEVYPNEMYTYERINSTDNPQTIYSGNPFTIVANVGLMYASDYGYGTDFASCNETLYNYNSDVNSYACRTNNWLFNSVNQWLINPTSSNLIPAWFVRPSGDSRHDLSVFATGIKVRPTLYLEPSVLKVGGDGSYANPYMIGSASEQNYYLMEVEESQTETSNFLRSTIKRNEISSVTFVDNNTVPEGYTGVDVSANNDGTVMMWYGNPNANGRYDIYMGSVYGKVSISSGAYLFQQLINCTSISFNNLLDTSNASSFLRMFDRCLSLTSLDVSSFNTSKVTNMERVFQVCINIESLDLSNWDTSNVTTMYGMFLSTSERGSMKLKTIVLDSWDTSNVIIMQYMFQYCSNLNKLDLSNWDVSRVENMRGMFIMCYNLEIIDITNWNTLNLNSTAGMFEDCNNLTTINGISSLNTSNVTETSYMFNRCYKLSELDISGWNTSKVINMSRMFQECTVLTTLDISGWNTSNLESTQYMFNKCTNLTTIYVSNKWNTNKVSISSYMFSDCTSLVGGNGTTYNASYIDKTYARVDVAGTPGYFTLKTI